MSVPFSLRCPMTIGKSRVNKNREFFGMEKSAVKKFGEYLLREASRVSSLEISLILFLTSVKVGKLSFKPRLDIITNER